MVRLYNIYRANNFEIIKVAEKTQYGIIVEKIGRVMMGVN